MNLTRILVNEHAIARVLPRVPCLVESLEYDRWCARLTHADTLDAVFADAQILSPTRRAVPVVMCCMLTRLWIYTYQERRLLLSEEYGLVSDKISLDSSLSLQHIPLR